MKRTYRVEIVRAVFEKEAFEIFKKYEKHIHGKDDKSRDGYEKFLCSSPLYDPSCQEKSENFNGWEKH